MDNRHPWFKSVDQQGDYAQVIASTLASDPEATWVINSVIDLYHRQNDAIGEYARRRGIEHLYLAEIENIWIDDPEGEARFFENFRTNNPNEWERLSNGLNLYSFMIFQVTWLFSPVHTYLVSMSHGGHFTTADLFGDKDAYDRLRARFRPFSERLLQ